MSIDDFLGSSKGNIIQVETSKSDSYTSYENFYEPPYEYIAHAVILLVCLVFLLKGIFSLIAHTKS